jgi:TolB-like protein
MTSNPLNFADKCIDGILSSTLFSTSPRQRELLSYLARHSFAGGDAKRLKGYVIGLDVFGRGKDFDPTVDAIVRVEIGRLRRRLRDYYAGEGRDAPLCIEIPKGNYALVCRPRVAKPPRPSSAPAPSPVLPILAVLPLVNIGGDAGEDDFAEGLTDGLIHALSRLSGLRVISRLSSFAYRGTQHGTREIAHKLGAGYLLTGSIRRASGCVCVIAQLVDAATDTQIWSERFDSALEEVFALQDELTHDIVRTLQTRLALALGTGLRFRPD